MKLGSGFMNCTFFYSWVEKHRPHSLSFFKMDSIQLPNLSDYDPIKSAEGALDPLGLYAIADNLAIKLVPGIRERMSHPRFLTAIASSSSQSV